MKCLRILPEMWARTWCLFSSSTRNIAFGSGSTTVASTSIASSFFDKRLLSPVPCSNPAPVAQHPGARRGDRHRVLEVGRQRSVLGARRPAVGVHPDAGAAGVDHRLDRQHHARAAASAPCPARRSSGTCGSSCSEVPMPWPDELAHHREAVRLDVALDRVPDVRQPPARPHLRDRQLERLLASPRAAARASSPTSPTAKVRAASP